MADFILHLYENGHWISVVLTVITCFILSTLLFRWNKAEPKELMKRKSLYRYLSSKKSVVVASTIAELESAWSEFSAQINGIMGLDCEWTTTEESIGPIALLQLALPTGACLLVRISHLESEPRSAFPLTMREVLADRHVLKFGVAVTQDSDKFFQDFCLPIRGCVDLRHLVIRIRNNGLKRRGLKNIAKEWLGIVYESGKEVQCSVWDHLDPLTATQVEYSAMDALVAVYAVAEFLFRKKKLDNVTNAMDMQSLMKEELNYAKLRPFSQGLVDKRFKIRSLINYPDEMASNNNGEYKISNKRKNTKIDKHNKIPQRKSPLYTNAVMLDPAGQILCTLDARKAQWYINKDLAELVPNADESDRDKLTIQLNFEPAGHETGEDWKFYVEEKLNRCVVCGTSDAYARKHIVPTEYRRHFPTKVKGHKSHDVLLLCLPCHRQSSLIDDDFKREIADEFDAPQGTSLNVAYHVDFDIVSVVRAAKALKVSGDKIPEPRRTELESIVRNYLSSTRDKEASSAMTLHDCLNEIERNPPISRQRNENFVPHGEIVVRKLRDIDNGIIDFEKRWRQHFLDTMQPKFLPTGWSVDHRRKKFVDRKFNVRTFIE